MAVHKTALDDRLWLVQAGGRLDAAAVPELETALRELVDQGVGAMIVDLAQATYISSSGLKVIVSTWRALRARGGDLVLAGLGPRLLEIFDMVGFTQIFRIYDTAAEAQADLTAER